MNTPADVQLLLYNETLRLHGERQLMSLKENSETRRLLDNGWAANLVDTCLEQGQWNFATRAISLTYSPSVEPAFGYRYAFNQPDDMVRVTAVCFDEKFDHPLLRYNENAGYWFTDLDTIFVKYVSNDDAYGADYSRWTNLFRKFVACQLAIDVAPQLAGGADRLVMLQTELKRRLQAALSMDGMSEPTKRLPEGTWVRSRWGNRGDGRCR